MKHDENPEPLPQHNLPSNSANNHSLNLPWFSRPLPLSLFPQFVTQIWAHVVSTVCMIILLGLAFTETSLLSLRSRLYAPKPNAVNANSDHALEPSGVLGSKHHLHDNSCNCDHETTSTPSSVSSNKMDKNAEYSRTKQHRIVCHLHPSQAHLTDLKINTPHPPALPPYSLIQSHPYSHHAQKKRKSRPRPLRKSNSKLFHTVEEEEAARELSLENVSPVQHLESINIPSYFIEPGTKNAIKDSTLKEQNDSFLNVKQRLMAYHSSSDADIYTTQNQSPHLKFIQVNPSYSSSTSHSMNSGRIPVSNRVDVYALHAGFNCEVFETVTEDGFVIPIEHITLAANVGKISSKDSPKRKFY
jgi:hypothetical protein